MGPESKGQNLPHGVFRFGLIFLFLVPILISASSQKGANYPPSFVNTTNSASTIQTPIIPKNDTQPQNGSTSSESVYPDPGELLRQALINHTLHHGGEQDLDGDLDKLILSTLPEGSKLVLQSVKVVQTDEDGNPLASSSRTIPVHWDVKITNATNNDDQEEDDDYEEDESEEEHEKGNSTVPEDKTGQSDLAISGSHSQASYKVYGTKQQAKDKTKKIYHGNDYGKTKKVTHTDTDGVTDTNYKGKEHGIRDYDKDYAKKTKDEVERYRDTKKKNKGRRVSGFKRVYHKEEFQRTEHFYDDEDAKRIAESYGHKDQKENKGHGLKDDDRKFHGTVKEYVDGNKVKNEVGKSHGFKHGDLSSYKDSEKIKQSTHYGTPTTHTKYSQHKPQYYHPSHNYHASYSNPKTTVRHPPTQSSHSSLQNLNYNNYKPVYTSLTANKDANINDDPFALIAKVPITASFVVNEYKDASTASSSLASEPEDSPKSAQSNLDQVMDAQEQDSPDEVKMYFSPRERKVENYDTNSNSITAPYKISRYPMRKHLPPYSRTTFRSKIGNFSEDDSDRSNFSNYYKNSNRTFDNERYARKFPASTVRNTLFDPSQSGYSTLVKLLPVDYINLDGSSRQNNDSRQASGNSFKVTPTQSQSSLVGKQISITTISPMVRRPPPPPSRGRWISISFGDPDLVKDIQSSPFQPHPPSHNYEDYPPRKPMSMSNIVRGVKQTLMRPLFVPRFPQRHQGDSHFDTSKYPPNVVVKSLNGSIVPTKNNTKPQVLMNYQEHNLVALNNPHYQRKPQNGILTRPSNNGYGHGQVHPNRYQNGQSPHRQRTPHSLPPFMNNLMDSVANFFSSVG